MAASGFGTASKIAHLYDSKHFYRRFFRVIFLKFKNNDYLCGNSGKSKELEDGRTKVLLKLSSIYQILAKFD